MPVGVPMRDLPRIRLSVSRAETMYGAARAYVYDALDQVWAELQRAGELSRPTRIQLSLSRTNAFRMARDVAQLMVDTVGTQAIYSTSPLDRLLRDAITINQHIIAQDRLLEVVGGFVLGQEPPLPFL
jgi:alkylation response protein AidB-like acyl-CoA dehydrogenase